MLYGSRVGQRDLRFRVGGPLGPTARLPVVADQADVQVQRTLSHDIAHFGLRSPHNHLQRALLLGRLANAIQSGFELFLTQMHCGRHDLTPLFNLVRFLSI